MPISFRFLLLFRPGFAIPKLIRFEPPGPMHFQRLRDAEQAMLVRELSKRLPPHLKRDVLPDGE